MSNIILSALVVLLTLYAQIALRLRLNNGVSGLLNDISFTNIIKIFSDIWIFTALSAFFLSFVCWSMVLSSELNITKAYPIITSSTILLVCLANFLIFNDAFKWINVCGLLVVIGGIFLLLK